MLGSDAVWTEGAYLRYVDDMAFFSNSRRELWQWKGRIVKRLAALRLTIHRKIAQVQPVESGLPWLGFVVYPTHRRLKRRNVVRCQRRLGDVSRRYEEGSVGLDAVNASVRGWVNHARYGDTWGLRRSVLGRIRL